MPYDKPLTHPQSSTSYASTVKKVEPTVGAGTHMAPPGKPRETDPYVSPIGSSYAEALKWRGGPQAALIDCEPKETVDQIDEILSGQGKVSINFEMER